MADEPEQKMTVRERRAQHAKATAVKTAPMKIARKAIVPAIVLLVIAGIAAGFYFTNKAQGQCPGHWHATFDLYTQTNNGPPEPTSFRHPRWDLNPAGVGETPYRAHMHQGDNKNQWHFEQGGQCVGIQEAFSYVDVTLKSSSVKLDGHHEELGQAGTYRANETHPLRAFIQHISDRGERDAQGRVTTATLEWREHSVGSILDYQLKDGERLLVLAGSYTDEQVAQFQAALAPVDGYAASVYQA